MKTNDLRKTYLDFFKSKDHRAFASDSLVPADDPSLLFTGAGMNQFKPYFLGLKKDLKRATSCQKCLRTADLDRVGKTAYHHSFFEMLGNFSFGDYFKEEAIAYGWEFVTKALGIPKEKLWVSVFEEDDEAFEIWKRKVGVQESRIVRMGPEDNFWPSNARLDGPNGPCGPCSEIYVGETPGKGVEIWNLVFTQFDRQSDASLKDLPQRNIDTGMGLERTAAVLQGVENNFDTDNFVKIRDEMKRFMQESKRQVSEKEAKAHENAVMDHMRAAIFSIGDGALPSNEGRGYVIRKIIRLASDHFTKAGAVRSGELCKLVPGIVGVYQETYPELIDKQNMVAAIIENEEKSYLDVLKTQIPKLETSLLSKMQDDVIKEINSAADRQAMLSSLATQVAFKYYDTYGLPMDIIETTTQNTLHVSINKTRFYQLLEEQKERSRASSKIGGEIFTNKGGYGLADDIARTEFLGYQGTDAEGTLLRIIRDNGKVLWLRTGEEGVLIFNRSPFYAESGGQIGDTGVITGKNFKANVLDTQNLEKAIAHKVRIESGEAREGESCHLKVDKERRDDIMKNHTATHLLQSALRKALGDHVKQSGSLVAADKLRFDFTHFKALEPETLLKIEDLVNAEIKKNISLDKKVLPKEEALKGGAIAFFGEKYEDEVRVVTIGEFSKELCGGTHLHSTGEIGLFKIISESSIQAGVRRIEAVTGRKATQVIQEKEREIEDLAAAFKVRADILPESLRALSVKLGGLKNSLLIGASSAIRKKIAEDLKKSEEISGAKFLIEKIDGADSELLKVSVEYLKSLNVPFATMIFSTGADKISFVVAASQGIAQKGFNAGKIVKDISMIVQGSGGGRPDFAMGGGKALEKEADALSAARNAIREALTAAVKGN